MFSSILVWYFPCREPLTILCLKLLRARLHGDLASGVIAASALIGLRINWSIARAVVRLFNIVGTVDLLNALRQGDAWVVNMGAA
jgi:hypothetical protein